MNDHFLNSPRTQARSATGIARLACIAFFMATRFMADLFSTWLVVKQHGAPGESTAKGLHQYGIATFDAAIAHRNIKCQRN